PRRANSAFLAAPCRRRLLLNNRQDVPFAHDEVLVAVDDDLGARVLGVDDPVAFLDRHLEALAFLVDPARAHGHHLALLRPLLGGVRKQNAARGALLFLERLNDYPVGQGLQVHRWTSSRRNFPPGNNQHSPRLSAKTPNDYYKQLFVAVQPKIPGHRPPGRNPVADTRVRPTGTAAAGTRPAMLPA